MPAKEPKHAIQQQLPAVVITEVQPTRFEKRGEVYFADFGADVFGNLRIAIPGTTPAATLTIRLGEKLNADGTIDRTPPGSVSFHLVSLTTQSGKNVYQPEIPLKAGYQSQPSAIRAAPKIGNIAPFRYAEIEGCPVALEASALRQLFVHTAFDDNASAFHCSDDTLNAVWDLCKHTMKATTAFGVYIDGDRERRPYEADAYINFLSHLACDFNPEVGRYSIEYLLANKTWPTEWSFHMPMMAAAEYEATGDPKLAARNYAELKTKLMMDKAREDGLIVAKGIIDWPGGERDGCEADRDVSTVVNAFYYHSLRNMAALASALRKDDDAKLFETKAAHVHDLINTKFFDATRGLYIDGEGSTHASLHANLFPLAFGLVPAERQEKVADFVQSRGMACSVYGAQYLLEALYNAGKDDYALQLLTSRGRRSWWNMIQVGSTMTLEAWDGAYKPNLTWNHSWGAAPANIISRFLVGVRPLAPGYEKILIAPRPGTLKSAKAKVPTPRGPVWVNFENGQTTFKLDVKVPAGTTARVSLPVKNVTQAPQPQVSMDGKPVAVKHGANSMDIENVPPGVHAFEVR